MKMKQRFAFLLFNLSLWAGPPLLSQTVVTLTECNHAGWVKQFLDPNGKINFINAPQNSFMGKGSLEMYSPQGYVRFRNTLHHHRLLSEFTELSFSAIIANRSQMVDAPYIVLQIDTSGDNALDANLVFNPVYQTGSYAQNAQVPDQGLILDNVWQTWDAANGAWWAGIPPEDNGPLFTLADFVQKYPTARIVNQGAMGSGGIRLTVGGPVGIFGTDFRAYIDNFRIGINGATTIYDFEFFIAADAGPDQTVVYGSECTALTAQAAGGAEPYQFAWSGGTSPDSMVNLICPQTTTTYTLTVTDSLGCTGSDQVTVFVLCGPHSNKVRLCHNGHIICAAAASLKAHLAHNDDLNDCSTSSLIVPDRVPGKLQKVKGETVSVYPNPFSEYVRFAYEVPVEASVLLSIQDFTGRTVAVYDAGIKSPGVYTTDLSAGNFSNGIYYYTLVFNAPGQTPEHATGKLMVIH